MYTSVRHTIFFLKLLYFDVRLKKNSEDIYDDAKIVGTWQSGNSIIMLLITNIIQQAKVKLKSSW